MTESFRLRYVNWIVGLFLLLIMIIALGSALAVILATDTFVKKSPYIVRVTQEELGSLKTEADVFLLGERVGKVVEIKFEQDPDKIVARRDITIRMLIRSDVNKKITADSKVMITQPLGGIANSYVDIRRGSSGVEMAENQENDREFTVDTSDSALNDVAKSVNEGMAQIVDNFDRARSSIVWGMNAFRSLSQTSERGVDPALEELRKAIAELRASTARTEATLKNTLEDIAETSRTMNERTKTSSATLDTNIEEMEQTVADANRNLKIAIEKVSRDLAVSLEKFNDVMDDIKKVSKDLPDTMDEVNDAVADADDVIDGVKKHPLLRKHVKQEQGTRQNPPSGIRGGGP